MNTALLAALAGLGTGLSLIVAIGAQNAFVLRQGIRREHVAVVVAICALSDVVLISAGIGGVGSVVRTWPTAITVTGWLGGAFLVSYGLLAARRAFRPQRLEAAITGGGSLRAAVLTCLAMTWLNPHVYLDTLLLLGSLANGYGRSRWGFGVGAMAGSVVWFAGLGFGARLLERPFSRPGSWRVLDAAIACMMIGLGVLMVART
ncbi:LysE/ArgO family amino acid transporter [Actinacidiphila epipremni]|jgi:L-lysine exporter family protein LysE/ArgO|uniref:LysE family transporter n=1 Tax=Actinacidiphila epipremni TaxID=2053013 RepID=A0ABX0ZWT4_9ACTN|nr:LysE family transporter [Actinacidiphila epipremni]NJP47227.1 LysE family transporter [Actinacidiphila epipremni]